MKWKSGRRAARAILAAVTGFSIASCGGGDSPPPLSPTEVYFAEQLGLAVMVDQTPSGPAAEGSVGSPVIANLTDHPLTIVAIDGFDTDPGLALRYVGTCSRGCIGTGKANDPDVVNALQHFIEHTVPVTIPPRAGTHGAGMRMTFRVDVTAAGLPTISSSTGCLWVRAVRVTLADGRHLRITGPDGHVVMALFLDAYGLPSGAQRCPLSRG